MEELDFGGKPWQGRPKGNYWLPKEFWTWPEVRAIPLAALGTFVDFGIWSAEYNGAPILKHSVDRRSAPGADKLEAAGLWRRTGKGYVTKTIGELRSSRGRPGQIIRVSRRMSGGMPAPRTSAAMAVWALCASWSLNTDVPGYVPTEAALTIGKQKHVAELWDCGLWLASEHGFLMSRGDHPIDELWDLTRDDERVPIPPALRQSVYDRDGWKCVRCGSVTDLTLDHIVPWIRGGADAFGNFQTLCRPCNSAKGARAE